MIPIKFEECNFTFTAPPEMENCVDLPVYKGNTDYGDPIIVSAWKLDQEEIKTLLETKIVYLAIYGQGMPPVSLFVDHPF